MDILTIPVTAARAGRTPSEVLESFAIARRKAARVLSLRCLRMHGLPVDPALTLAAGDVLELDLAPFEGIDFIPEAGPVEVLFENASVAVFAKPAGIIVHPDGHDGTGTFVNRLARWFQEHGLDRRIAYLHRLDRDTSGCLLVAKHFLAHALLTSQWDHETVSRSYLAVVAGRFPGTRGTIDLPLGRDRHVAGRYRVQPGGIAATTHYEVLSAAADRSVLRLVLETGRTHQIRVHLAHAGHPLLGDVLYGGPADAIRRTALHAETLRFPDPLSGETIAVTAPLPEDIARLLR